ncbi:MAG: hypothetical protein KDD73_13045 [Anaerolineales bacterium]|nr:hypothetical protein [Anaerolineales bacterium]MCB9128769.1 hypothetical protein [Ardenticatenales bacterium]
MGWEIFWRAAGWFTMIWFVVAGLSIIAMQVALPRAQREIRANPPTGPAWAHRLWTNRQRVYAGIIALAMALGGVAALIYLVAVLI